MSLIDSIKREFRSVIKWENPLDNEIFHLWSDRGDEIKNASKLIVSPTQGVIFIYEGKIVSIFDKEGIFDIKTSNIPFITTLKKFMQFFESEHKSAFYFYKKSVITNVKWGTLSAIKYLDPFFNFPVKLMAFGNYSFQIKDPRKFFISFVGNKESFLVDNFKEIMNARLLQIMTDFFAESKYSYIEIDSKLEEVVEALFKRLKEEFVKFGFDLTDFRVEGTAFDEESQKRIDEISNVLAKSYAAKKIGISYQKLRELDALNEAASNENGTAGVFMAANVGNSLLNNTQNTPQNDIVSRLKKLKELYDMKLIEEKEFLRKKEEILKEI